MKDNRLGYGGPESRFAIAYTQGIVNGLRMQLKRGTPITADNLDDLDHCLAIALKNSQAEEEAAWPSASLIAAVLR